MFLYPALPGLLHLTRTSSGCGPAPRSMKSPRWWRRRSRTGEDAGQFGTIAKLSRVMLLAPLVISLGLRRGAPRQRQPPRRAPLPWFVLGFIALIGVNSLGVVPAEAKQVLVPATTSC